MLPSDTGGTVSGSVDWRSSTSNISGFGTVVIDEVTTKSWDLTISGNPADPTVTGTNYGTVAIAQDGSSVFMMDDMSEGTYPDRTKYYYCKDGVETETTNQKANNTTDTVSADYLPVDGTVLSASYYPEQD